MRALVLGSAQCLHADREAVDWAKPDRVYAVNFAGIIVPDADVWVMGHAEHVADYLRRFRAWGRPLPEIVAGTHRRHLMKGKPPKIDRFEEPIFEGQKSKRFDSGLMGVRVALGDGATKVIVCGIPLSVGANLNAWTPAAHTYATYRQAWEEALPHMRGKVKAVSGFPRSKLGAPSRAWWNDREA
jgi:hypothetical protein